MTRSKPRIVSTHSEILGDANPILTEEQATARAGVPLSTWRQWRRDKTGPPAIRYNRKTLRWLQSDVDAWVLGQREDRGAS